MCSVLVLPSGQMQKSIPVHAYQRFHFDPAFGHEKDYFVHPVYELV